MGAALDTAVAPDSTSPARAGVRERVRAVPAEAWALGLSLNGFFLYLAALDLVGVAPRTALTGTYYALLGAVLTALAWRNRGTLVARLGAPTRVPMIYAAAAVGLAAAFLLNVALLSEGSLAWRLAALLVLSTLPTALLAASASHLALVRTLQVVAGLGVVFVAVELLAVARALDDDVKRFSPISALDPISAALIPALAALAALALPAGSRRARLLQAGACGLFAAAAVLPGSRGPVLALVVGVGAMCLGAGRPLLRVAAPALALGAAAGWLTASLIGTTYYLTYSTPGLPGTAEPEQAPDAPEPISSLAIRRQWLEKSLRQTPDRPLFGHGVAMFVDDTPEARRMAEFHKTEFPMRTYPHNSFVEAGFSLGVPGILLYGTLLGAAAAALLALFRGRLPRGRIAVFTLGAFAYALVNAALSGEIGADVLLWSAGALAVALYADERRATASR